MSEIEVGGHLYPKVNGSLIGELDLAWARFLEEMRAGSKEFGRNNNNAKERINLVLHLATRLAKEVNALPAQGRVIGFSGSSTATAAELMRRLNP